MQYLLSEDEYNDLTDKKTNATKCSTEQLQKLCTLAAIHVPTNRDFDPDDKSPWGCILTTDTDNWTCYCDNCPAQDVCPEPKKLWGK